MTMQPDLDALQRPVCSFGSCEYWKEGSCNHPNGDVGTHEETKAMEGLPVYCMPMLFEYWDNGPHATTHRP